MHPLLFLMIHRRVPGQLVIQMTDQCNARCPQCGMRVTEKFKRSTLRPDDIKRMLDAAAQRNFQSVSFTGGEPMLHINMLCDLIRHAGRIGIPFIRTGTNGFVFSHPEKNNFKSRIERLAEKLAQTPIRNFWISIDSAEAKTHEKMRGFKNLIRGIETALPIFHSRGLYPSANLGINRNLGGETTRFSRQTKSFMSEEEYLSFFYQKYKEGFDRFYRFIINLGFTIVNTCYPMSIGDEETSAGLNPVYAATTTSSIVRYSSSEKSLMFKALIETVKKFRSKIRIFSPLCALHTLHTQYKKTTHPSYSCLGGIDFFFVDAKDADTYPCGYRGKESLGKIWNLNLKKLLRPHCTLCDWECFRDPSELFGPILEMSAHPIHLGKKFYQSPEYFQYWYNDLKYYRACNYFNGRKAPNYTKLKIMAQKRPKK